MSAQPRICLVSASGQNVFFGEILEALGLALRDSGVVVEESVDRFPPLADGLVYLFVAHEYQPLVHEAAHPSDAQLRRSIALAAEQPGTSWFETVAEIAARAGAVVDINAIGARELSRRGIETEHAPLGYIPSWDVWQRREEPRSIDMAFLGRHTERRARAIARCAPALERRRAAIHLTETFSPHVAGSPYFLAGERRARLLADSKVLLNVHQQELAYMEWHRVLSAVLNGCVVVSEHSLAIEPFVPGEHFVSADYDDLPHVLEAVLADPERRRRIAYAAYDLVREELPMTGAVDAILRAAERAAQSPAGEPGPIGPPAPPLPKPLPERQPEWEAQAAWLGDQLPVRRALKHLVLRMRELERRVGDLSADGPAREEVEELGPRNGGVPRVSVLLTVHDYADVVGDALRSVALSDFDDVEVVAVDDGSNDGSAEAVRAACAELPWLAVRLVRRDRNGGLAVARNTALAHARADLAFVLDADNAVGPQGLRLLTQALEDEPDAAFSYGILEAFDASGPVGLRSWLGWDPSRLRYGNYVDAMAIVRRSALDAVGGYPTDVALTLGWEDFAVWVALADRGLRGVRVPEIVGRYRVSPYSMLSLTDIDHSEAWATLLRRYPVLAAGG